MKNDRVTGLIAAIFSALFFGFSPALAKLAYRGGSNPLTMTFTRSLLALPLLILLAGLSKVSLKPRKEEVLPVLLVSLFGAFATTLLLYSSYAYMAVGMATVLHYLFPVLVMLGGLLFFGEKTNKMKTLALLLGFSGVLTFVGSGARLAWQGILLAVVSAFTYAGLMIGMERTAIKEMPVLKMAVYSNALACLASLLIGLSSSSLNLRMTGSAWLISLLVALMVAVGAFTLLNLAVVKTGATTTAIVAMLEPLTSVFMGAILLKEKVSPLNLLGFVLIMSGVLLVSLSAWKGDLPKQSSETYQ
ncbi:MAG TPA: DMT family transporter [Clostridia bacterium]|nr:DMT family transporter [Clostridia bacterium]